MISAPGSARTVRHPADLAVLPFLMLIFIALGALGAAQWNDEGGIQPWAVALTVTSAASFVALLTIYWVGWLLRGHAEWLESRQNV